MLSYDYGCLDIQEDRAEIRSEVIVETTSQMENLSIYDVSLVSLIIDDLTEDAVSNPVVSYTIKLLIIIIVDIMANIALILSKR